MIMNIIMKLTHVLNAARNIFVVVGASIIAYAVTDMSLPVEERPITLTKQITPGLPPVAVPRFSISYPVDGGNTTGNATMATADFGELIGHLGSGLIVIPLVGFLESIAIAKSFGKIDYLVFSVGFVLLVKLPVKGLDVTLFWL